MKFSTAVLTAASLSAASAFQPTAFTRTTSTALFGLDLSGNNWKPDSEKMGSTDVGDYFPDGYDKNEVDFTEGMMGSQDAGNKKDGPARPGLDTPVEFAMIGEGIQVSSDIPAGMEFIPSSVPDQELSFNVPSTTPSEHLVQVKPVCMTYEDFFGAFSADSFPGFSVSPATGRMDRRGGEPSELIVRIDPKGANGELVGNLVINLPEDNSKICYKITANSN